MDNYQSNEVSGSFESVDGGRMRDVNDRDVVNFENDVVDLEAAVDGGGPAADDLRQANGRIVGQVRIVRPTGDAEAQARVAPFQNNLFVVPTVVPIRLRSIHQSIVQLVSNSIQIIIKLIH